MTTFRKARSATAAIVTEEDSGKALPKAASAPNPRMQILEKELEKARSERDDLARDVEALCMQSGSSIFDGSMVLSERIFSAEKELSKTKAQLAVVTEERNNLKEDLRGHKDSKRAVDNSWRVEKTRADKLERELQFYQAQSAVAMSDRDKATWEAEELKRAAMAMEVRLNTAESCAETATTELSELQSQLREAQSRIQDLEVKARESETIPGLWRHIAENTQQIREMEVAHEALERSLSMAKSDHHEAREMMNAAQQKLAGAEKELEETRAKAHSDSKAAAAKIKALEAKVAEHEAAAVTLELQVEEAEGNLAAAQAELETTTNSKDDALQRLSLEHAEKLATMDASHVAEIEPLRKELEEVKARLKQTSADLEKVSAEKVQALLRVEQAEQTATQAFEETGNLLDQIADLKARATQATQEKVAALLQVASLREQLRSAGKATPATSPHLRATGWRLWGAGNQAGDAAEEHSSLSNGAAPGKVESKSSDPSDLRQAIDQLRACHERLAELSSLANGIQHLRQQSEEVQLELTGTPTHLQRKELAKKLETLKSGISTLEAEHANLLEESKASNVPAADDKHRKAKQGDSIAAGELVALLRLALDGLEQQSKQ